MDSIEVRGYKSIKEINLELGSINILIGSNGSGKSNFLSFFEFLNGLSERRLQEYVALRGGEDKFLHRGAKVTSEIFAKIRIGKNGYSFAITRGDEGFVFTSEGLWYDRNPYIENPVDISDFKKEANLKNSSIARADYIRKYLNSIKKYHFHDTGRNSPFNGTSHVHNDIYYLYERGENLAAFLFNIHATNKIVYKRIINTIQSIAPFFSDFYFKPNKEGFIRLQWKDTYSSVVYGASDLSDGTIRFIALATLFLQPELPETVIIDEPELGLHPVAISKLAGMIQSAASKKVQVIVATQSTDLINYFDPSDIVTVDQRNGESLFHRLKDNELAEWLNDYSVGDLWQRNIINGGQPR